MAGALTLMIIRHAEKPGQEWPGPGLTEKGEANEKSLVIRGWERAGAWAALFGSGLGGRDYPAPSALFACRPEGSSSQRASDTLLPLSTRLGMEIDLSFAQGEEDRLMDEILKLSGVALICWEHKRIGEGILPLIPVEPGVLVPAHWPSDRFDVVLRFDRLAGADSFSFRQLCPRLLSGDSERGI
ncbi:MAG: histidine phosphatase family protein [Caulobacteraceae bacterium]|nr:histidine phosphatase family protein [Caulobacteraceae bacterium]